MSSLSDKELAQAAAEAGISPKELKEALARRESGELVEKEASSANIKTHATVQARFSAPPSQALHRAHQVFNQQLEHVASRSKDGQIQYINEETGIAYRLTSESDGTPTGSLVKVDIDVSRRMRKLQRVTLPVIALFVVLGLLAGGFSASAYITGGALSLLLVYSTRRQTLKLAESTARAALDRANQEALPGRGAQ